MLSTPSWIAQALAPGLALSAIIFYNGSLQNRFVHITTLIRDLNAEARRLRLVVPLDQARIESLHWQVAWITRRASNVRSAILILSTGFLSFIATIMLLGAIANFSFTSIESLPYFTFSFGFLCFIVAAVLQIREMYMADATIVEDTKTSFSGPTSL